MEKAENFNDEKKMISVKIISVGAPKYKIDLEAPNYKIAETILSDISKTVIDEIVNNNGIAQFSRE